MLISKSPLFYQGNKYSVIEDLINRFPNKTKIRNFYDAYGGSGVVGLNASSMSKKIFYNEINPLVFNMFDYCLNNHPEETINKMLAYAKEKDLPFKICEGVIYLEDIKKINKFFKHNNHKGLTDPFESLFLQNYTFCNTLRMTDDGALIKQSAGSRCLSIELYHSKLVNLYNVKDKFVISKMDAVNFINLNIGSMTDEDFVYLDPPYATAQTTYNKWYNEKNEDQLFDIMEQLQKKGIRFGMSNALFHKEQDNNRLNNWLEKNKDWVFVHKYERVFSGAGGNDPKSINTNEDGYIARNISVECYISNYDFNKENGITEQISLF